MCLDIALDGSRQFRFAYIHCVPLQCSLVLYTFALCSQHHDLCIRFPCVMFPCAKCITLSMDNEWKKREIKRWIEAKKESWHLIFVSSFFLILFPENGMDCVMLTVTCMCIFMPDTFNFSNQVLPYKRFVCEDQHIANFFNSLMLQTKPRILVVHNLEQTTLFSTRAQMSTSSL